jgi:pre-mRNA branch site protein p14
MPLGGCAAVAQSPPSAHLTAPIPSASYFEHSSSDDSDQKKRFLLQRNVSPSSLCFFLNPYLAKMAMSQPISVMKGRPNARLPPEVNRVLFVRNLPFKISADEMYELFGKYGPIRQIRMGSSKATVGTAFVVYDDIFDAKNACDHLSGFSIKDRYLIVLYHQTSKQLKKTDLDAKEQEVSDLKRQRDSMS